jgi:spore photoproduct lyase
MPTKKRKIEIRLRSEKKLIREYTGTPEHEGTGQDIICPHFWILAYATGCTYDCEWCYLKKTMRRIGTHPIIYGGEDRLNRSVQKWLKRPEPSLLNTGELADSLGIMAHRRALRKTVMSLFAEQNRHALLLLTRSTKIQEFKETEPISQVIFSFSLNAAPVARRYEHGAPDVEDRLDAAKELSVAGWRVRARVDPLIPLAEDGRAVWESSYADLAGRMNQIPWERVTLGSLRGLPGLPKFAPSDVWKYASAKNGADKRVRLQKGVRVEMYEAIADSLDCEEIGLCKETREVWREAGLNPIRPRCNCTP